jgi:CRISPR-associated protein (TIGR02584 family)
MAINSDPKKGHILVAVAGNTTQIVTETLYYLMIQHRPHVPISDVYIMTTTHGKEVAWKTLGGDEGAIARFYRDYDLDPIAFTKEKHILVFKNPDGSFMQDIRTTADNYVLQSQMLGFMRDFTSNPDCVLHCIVGGGRRTMTANMMLALTIFGREQDSLTHVLVDEKFETNPAFFFPTKKKNLIAVFNNGELGIADASKARISLAEIPFARLRDLYGKNIENLETDINKLLNIAQTKIELSQVMHEQLLIDLKNGRAFWGNEEIDLKGFNLAMFMYYALAKVERCSRPDYKSCDECYDCFSNKHTINIERFVSIYNRAQGKKTFDKSDYRRNFPDIYKSHNLIEKKNGHLSHLITIDRQTKSGQAVYGLKLDKTRIQVRKPDHT